MKRFCAIVILLTVYLYGSFDAFAQKRQIKAKLQKEEIEKVSRDGAAVDIELNDKSIAKEWESHLKGYGKLAKLKDGAYKVTEASVPGVNGTCVIYAKCYSKGKGYTVWWSIDNGADIIANSKATEKKLEDFARQQYVNDVNAQIKDAEDAVKSATKAHEKQIGKGEDLVKDIEKNGKEKIKLQEAIKKNEQDLIQLQKDVEQNKGDQKKAADEVAKMQKALEVVKGKLNDL